MSTVTFTYTMAGDWEHLRQYLQEMKPGLSQLGEIKNDPARFYKLDHGVRNVVGLQHRVTHGCWKMTRGVHQATYFWSKYKLVVAYDQHDNWYFNIGYSGMKVSLSNGTPLEI